MTVHEQAHETLTTAQALVVDRLAEACRILGADASLMAIVDAWSDGALPDEEAMALLDDWCERHADDEDAGPGQAPYPDPPF